MKISLMNQCLNYDYSNEETSSNRKINFDSLKLIYIISVKSEIEFLSKIH